MALAVSLLGGGPLTAQHAPVSNAPTVGMPTMSVFIVAHPDDWQLFMGDVAVRHLARDDRALFLVVSAGDAGRPANYWQARESGAVASMRAALALTDKPTSRAVTRFLRVPDGKPDGAGFAATGFQSLQKLERHLLPQLVTIDGATRYTDVTDIMRELRAIIRRETDLGLYVHIHTHDPDLRYNPGDHADHRSVGRLALALGHAMHVPVTLYSGYVNIRRADNLDATDAAHKAWLFVTYDRARMAVNTKFSAYCENPWAHVVYLSRTYARNAPLADGLLFRPMSEF
jgi:LmbE family N-acetylglucosaminyl deacetylase